MRRVRQARQQAGFRRQLDSLICSLLLEKLTYSRLINLPRTARCSPERTRQLCSTLTLALLVIEVKAEVSDFVLQATSDGEGGQGRVRQARQQAGFRRQLDSLICSLLLEKLTYSRLINLPRTARCSPERTRQLCSTLTLALLVIEVKAEVSDFVLQATSDGEGGQGRVRQARQQAGFRRQLDSLICSLLLEKLTYSRLINLPRTARCSPERTRQLCSTLTLALLVIEVKAEVSDFVLQATSDGESGQGRVRQARQQAGFRRQLDSLICSLLLEKLTYSRLINLPRTARCSARAVHVSLAQPQPQP